jgi:F-type H+-transporting ATPase subunit delta
MRRLTAKQYAAALHGACEQADAVKRKDIVVNFLQILTRRRAMKLMPRIIQHLQQLADQAAKVTRVKIWSARRVDEQSLQTLVKPLARHSVIEANVDPKLLGGIKVRIGDQLIDGTLRHRLTRLHTHLTS